MTKWYNRGEKSAVGGQRRKSLSLLRVEGAHGGGSGITKEVSLLPDGVENQEKRAAGRKA